MEHIRNSQEEDRAENLEKYETLVNNLSVGVYRNTPGPQGHFLEANPAMITMFEADSKEEFMKRNVSDLYQDPAKRALFVEKVMKQGFVKNEELELVTLKGKKIVGSVSTVMKKDKDGSVYFDGIVENITDQKRMEAELKEYEEEKFKMIFDHTNDGMVLVDIETTQFSLSNPAFCRMLGYSPEEVRQLKIEDIIPKEDLAYALERFEKHVKGEASLTEDLRVKRKDGTIFYSDTSSSPVITLEGKKYLLGVFKDVTERRKIEQQRHESEEKFSAAFNASPDLMAITRVDDGKIIEINEGYTRLLGYSREESVGKTTVELSIWADAVDRAKFVAGLEADGQVLDFETTLRRKDGSTVSVRDSARTFSLQGQKYILSIAHDITDRKEAEKRDREYLEELEKMNKLMVGRELRMLELKEEVEKLKQECSKQKKL